MKFPLSPWRLANINSGNCASVPVSLSTNRTVCRVVSTLWQLVTHIDILLVANYPLYHECNLHHLNVATFHVRVTVFHTRLKWWGVHIFCVHRYMGPVENAWNARLVTMYMARETFSTWPEYSVKNGCPSVHTLVMMLICRCLGDKTIPFFSFFVGNLGQRNMVNWPCWGGGGGKYSPFWTQAAKSRELQRRIQDLLMGERRVGAHSKTSTG